MKPLVVRLIAASVISATNVGYVIAGEARGDGPFDANGFVRQEPASDFSISKAAAVHSVTDRAPVTVIFDEQGNSNQLIVRFNYDQPDRVVDPALLDSENSRKDFEHAVVGSVVRGDSKTRGVLLGAVHAHHLTEGMRLSKEQREAHGPDHPREQLEQFIVLTYPTVAAAQHAEESLKHDPAVSWVGMNRRARLSWTPSDPYFSRKTTAVIGPTPAPGAGTYQWGMQAMSFPAAWDITKGNAYVSAVDMGMLGSVQANGQVIVNVHADLKQNYRPQFSFAPTGWFTKESLDYGNVRPFHGTHVLGIIGAAANNGIGVSGGCPSCSIATYKVNVIDGGYLDLSSLTQGLVKQYELGMQVVNLSLNDNNVATACQPDSVSVQCVLVGPALSMLGKRDTLVVAAAGNSSYPDPRWPATEPGVLGVAGVQNTDPSKPSMWQLWTTGASAGQPDKGSNAAGMNGVVAPAKSIVSTVPTGMDYAGVLDCSDTLSRDLSGVDHDGYGTCTGTSMATPHVSALGGLLRSADPLRSAADIRSVIRKTASNSLSPNQTIGYGMPNAGAALSSMFAGTRKNKLTPLFSFYSENRHDFFYTTVPQMAMAALFGTLEPRRTNTSPIWFDYAPWGRAITSYREFPDTPQVYPNPGAAPMAEAWVFTTPLDPVNASIPLIPLYRMSWKCEDTPSAPPAICASVPNHTDTVYTTEQAGITAYAGHGYKLDGIEGYIYPKTIPKPVGTERLMRKYNPTRDDHAIFPESKSAEMTSLGYTENSFSDWLGYVYPNTTGAEPAITTDTVAPTVPTGLTAVAASASQINLSWKTATDNVGIAAYKVYRNGTLIATLGKVTSYSNSGLTPATTYSYAVQACDGAGNCSAKTVAVSVKTSADTVAPTVPTGLTAVAASTSQINLNWKASTDNVGVTAYKVYRNGTLIATLGNATGYSSIGLTPATTYSYAVQACDGAGNCSAKTAVVSANTPGAAAPTTPTGLAAVVASTSQINLSWKAAFGITAYKVYRNGALIATLGNVTSYSNTGLASATTYSYAVQACYGAGNCSAKTAAVSATTTAATYNWACVVAGPLPPPPNQAPNLCSASNIGEAKTIRIYYNNGTAYQDASCSCRVM
jgi:serine protease